LDFFGFFGIFNFLQFAVDGKNNSKTKVEKVFFFIFMSSYAEMSFLKQKSLNRVKKILFEIGRYGVKKIHNFTLISKCGLLSLYLAPRKSLSQRTQSLKNRVINQPNKPLFQYQNYCFEVLS
jgi:hypothetical protein